MWVRQGWNTHLPLLLPPCPFEVGIRLGTTLSRTLFNIEKAMMTPPFDFLLVNRIFSLVKLLQSVNGSSVNQSASDGHPRILQLKAKAIRFLAADCPINPLECRGNKNQLSMLTTLDFVFFSHVKGLFCSHRGENPAKDFVRSEFCKECSPA